jgi:hypothetical protein
MRGLGPGPFFALFWCGVGRIGVVLPLSGAVCFLLWRGWGEGVSLWVLFRLLGGPGPCFPFVAVGVPLFPPVFMGLLGILQPCSPICCLCCVYLVVLVVGGSLRWQGLSCVPLVAGFCGFWCVGVSWPGSFLVGSSLSIVCVCAYGILDRELCWGSWCGLYACLDGFCLSVG